MSHKKKSTPLGIYSSKTLSKNLGLFTAHGSSTGIGDPYSKKEKNDSKVTGKQFQVGRPAKDHFSPLLPLTIVPSAGSYKSDPYTPPVSKPDGKMLTQEPGFGSKNSRGIQNTVRASRMYSEKLRLESNALRRSALKITASNILGDSGELAAAASPEITLFDRCNAGEEDDSLRLKPGVGASKRIGSMTTTANVYGANVGDTPPVSGEHSRVAVTKSFYNDQALESASSNEYLNM